MRFEPSSTPAQIDTLHPSPLRVWAAQWAREMAPHDWLVLGYVSWLLVMALQGSGPKQLVCVQQTSLLLAVVLGAQVLMRGGFVREPGFRAALLYRVAVYGGVQLPYFILRDLLPTATTRRLDEALYRIDLALFGVEPTLWLDRLVTPAATEWFAFFYFSYFSILAVHILPMLFGSRRLNLLTEFATGVIGLFCVSQMLYFVVPGYGPYHHLEGRFEHALPPGFWWDTVLTAVSSSGALLDIFPSLHTGGPLYLALFSFRHRDKAPFRYTWPVTLFFSVNIIGATIFLRWHYAIDVLVGIAMAVLWVPLAGGLARYERERRGKNGVTTSSWPLLFGRQAD